jgi:ABC-type multidrug transport system ATPase subunit
MYPNLESNLAVGTDSSPLHMLQELGYCPQFDCVWKTITVREHLETYAAIRGVPPPQIPGLVNRCRRVLFYIK